MEYVGRVALLWILGSSGLEAFLRVGVGAFALLVGHLCVVSLLRTLLWDAPKTAVEPQTPCYAVFDVAETLVLARA